MSSMEEDEDDMMVNVVGANDVVNDCGVKLDHNTSSDMVVEQVVGETKVLKSEKFQMTVNAEGIEFCGG